MLCVTDTTLNNFCLLNDMVMKHEEAREVYMCRIRDAVTLLHEENVELHQIIITLFVIRGLHARYKRVNDDL